MGLVEGYSEQCEVCDGLGASGGLRRGSGWLAGWLAGLHERLSL